MNSITPFTAIPSQDFKRLIDTGEYFLLDIRTDGEVSMYGEIPGTQARYDIYQPDFPEKVLKLPKETKYLIYCWHGTRTKQARDWMKSEGFSWVCDLEGGIDKWRS